LAQPLAAQEYPKRDGLAKFVRLCAYLMSEGLRCLTASLFLDAAGGCDGLPDAQAGVPHPRSVAADDRRPKKKT
jgi:hypothetical protein